MLHFKNFILGMHYCTLGPLEASALGSNMLPRIVTVKVKGVC